MEHPINCPANLDKVYTILNVSRLIISCIILLFFHWGVSLCYLLFWLVYIFYYNRKYLCEKCVYGELGKNSQSVEEYHDKYGEMFQKRLTKCFPALIFDWFFAILIGVIIMIFNIILIPLILILIFFQLALLIISWKRIPVKHCGHCLYKEYCFVAKKQDVI